jgi:hypothetical protein
MAPAASTTDECPRRAAHPAARVRLVKVIPAADARDTRPIAPNRNRACAVARAAGRAIYTAGPRRSTTAPAQRRGARAVAPQTHRQTHAHPRTWEDACRWNGRTHSHAHPNARMRRRTRVHANAGTKTHAQTHEPHTSAWTLPHSAHAHSDRFRDTRTQAHSHTRTPVARTHTHTQACARSQTHTHARSCVCVCL